MWVIMMSKEGLEREGWMDGEGKKGEKKAVIGIGLY